MTTQSQEYHDNETFVENIISTISTPVTAYDKIIKTNQDQNTIIRALILDIKINSLSLAQKLYFFNSQCTEKQWDERQNISQTINVLCHDINQLTDIEVGKTPELEPYLNMAIKGIPFKRKLDDGHGNLYKKFSTTVGEIFKDSTGILSQKQQDDLFTILEITPK